MKKRYLFLLLISFFAFSTQADEWRGQKIFKRSCALCHGNDGEKHAMDQSKIINQMTQSEIIQALQDRKSGKIDGGGNRAKARLSEQDMQDVAEFIEHLPK